MHVGVENKNPLSVGRSSAPCKSSALNAAFKVPDRASVPRRCPRKVRTDGETIQIVDRGTILRVLRDRGIGIYKIHWSRVFLVKNLWTLNIARSGPLLLASEAS